MLRTNQNVRLLAVAALLALSAAGLAYELPELKELDGKYELNETSQVNSLDSLLCLDSLQIRTKYNGNDSEIINASSLWIEGGEVQCSGSAFRINPQTDLTYTMPFPNGKLIVDVKEGFAAILPVGESITCGNRTFTSTELDVGTFLWMERAVFRVIEIIGESETEYRVQIEEPTAAFVTPAMLKNNDGGTTLEFKQVCTFTYKESLSPCFPGSAQVSMADGSLRAASDVQLGDRVLSGPKGETSQVFFFTHRSQFGRHSFVELRFSESRNVTHQPLRLSGNHLIFAVNRGKLVPAQNLMVGDTLRLADGSVAPVALVSTARSGGLYHPHTLSGDIVVDGVVVSTYTTLLPPVVAHTLLLPIRALFLALGARAVAMVSLFDADAAPALLSAASLFNSLTR